MFLYGLFQVLLKIVCFWRDMLHRKLEVYLMVNPSCF